MYNTAYLTKDFKKCFVKLFWQKILPWATGIRHSPPRGGSRVRVSVSSCRFRGGKCRVWVIFSRGFSHFLLTQISFHHFSALILFNLFQFISSASVMVSQAWSAGILAIHRPSIKRLHLISFLDPALFGHELRIFIPVKQKESSRRQYILSCLVNVHLCLCPFTLHNDHCFLLL